MIATDNVNNAMYGKCIDYEKDKDKIEGYKKPLTRTAKLERTVMGLSSPDWR